MRKLIGHVGGVLTVITGDKQLDKIVKEHYRIQYTVLGTTFYMAALFLILAATYEFWLICWPFILFVFVFFGQFAIAPFALLAHTFIEPFAKRKLSIENNIREAEKNKIDSEKRLKRKEKRERQQEIYRITRKKKAELKQMALEKGLDDSGTVNTLRHRLYPNLFDSDLVIKNRKRKEKEKRAQKEASRRKMLEREQEEREIARAKDLEKKRSRYISNDVKAEAMRRSDGKCVKCGAKSNLQFDHIIPFSKGGGSQIGNIEVLCKNCNLEKSNKIEYDSYY